MAHYPKAGTGDEQYLVPTVTVPPALDTAEAAGPTVGPFEPNSNNTSRGVALYPAGNTNQISLSTVERTFRIKIFGKARTKIFSQQVVFKGFRADDPSRPFYRKDIVRGFRGAVPRFGLGIRNVTDASGDSTSTYRGINEQFAYFAAFTALGGSNVYCGRPALLDDGNGNLWIFTLIHDGSDNKVLVHSYQPAVLSVPFSAAHTSTALNTLTSTSAASTNAAIAACTYSGEIFLAVFRSVGTLGSATKALVHVLRVKIDPPNVLTTGTISSIDHVSTIDLQKQFGANIICHDSNVPCGIGLAGGDSEMVLMVGGVTQGYYSAAATRHLSVIYARSSDGVAWGDQSRATLAAPATEFVSLPNIQALGMDQLSVNSGGLYGTNPYNITSTHPHPPIRRASMVSATVGWAVGEDGTMWKTETAGSSWMELQDAKRILTTQAGTIRMYGCCGFDGDKAVACGEEGTVIYTRDGGVTWEYMRTQNREAQRNGPYGPSIAATNIGNTISTGALRAITSIDGATGDKWVTVGDGGRIYYTDNFGVTWAAKGQGTIAGSPTSDSTPHADTIFTDVARLDNGSTNAVIICGTPDKNNSNRRIRYTSDITAGSVSWTTTDVANPTGEALLGMTHQTAGVYGSQGNYGYNTGRGLMVGQNGLMISYNTDDSTPVELENADGNRWTSADLRCVFPLSVTQRFVGGSGGLVMRTIDSPAAATPVSDGTPSWSGEIIDGVTDVYACFVSSLTQGFFAGTNGFAVLSAAMTNRCFPDIIYQGGGAYYVTVANTSHGFFEDFISTDGGKSFGFVPVETDEQRVVTTAGSNAITADDGTNGTMAPSLTMSILGELLCTSGNDATEAKGKWGRVSMDGGATWVARQSQNLPLILGDMDESTTPATGAWCFNQKRATRAFGGGRICSVVFDDDKKEAALWIARMWSSSSTVYCPIAPGRSQFISTCTHAGDPRVVFSGYPAAGDTWISYPRYDYGRDKVISVESPQTACRFTNTAVNHIFGWDRQATDIVSVLGAGSHWDVTGCALFGTDFPYAWLDVSIPNYNSSTAPSVATDYGRFILSAVVMNAVDVTAEISANRIQVTGAAWKVNQWAPAERTYYAAFYTSNTAFFHAHKILGNTEDTLEIDRTTFTAGSPSDSYASCKVRIYGDRMVRVGGNIADGNGTQLAADWYDSTYRFARWVRLTIPASGAAANGSIQQASYNGQFNLGTAVIGTHFVVSGFRNFAAGFGWQPVVNSVTQRGPSGVSAVSHIGRLWQRWVYEYPATAEDQVAAIMGILSRNSQLRRAFALVFDDDDPTNSVELVRLVDSQQLTQFSTAPGYFRIPFEIEEVP